MIGTIFGGQNRKTTSLEEMPPHLLNALVAKEDERFREHGGVDLWGIMRALYVDIRAGADRRRGQHHHPAVRQERLPHPRSVGHPQGQGGPDRARDRAQRARQGPDNRRLPEHGLLRQQRLRGARRPPRPTSTSRSRTSSIAESATLVGLLWSPSTLGQDRDGRDVPARPRPHARCGDRLHHRPGLRPALERPDARDLAREPDGRNRPQRVHRRPATSPSWPRTSSSRATGSTRCCRAELSVYTTLDLEAQVAAREILYGPGRLPANAASLPTPPSSP